MAGERGLIARHAGTVLAGQLAVMAFGVGDTINAGRYSDGALAALSVGAAIYIYVNTRLVARGEVVIVDERLGVTMTEIIKDGDSQA